MRHLSVLITLSLAAASSAQATEGGALDYTSYVRVVGLTSAQQAQLSCSEHGEARQPDRDGPLTPQEAQRAPAGTTTARTGQWTSDGRSQLRCTWQGQVIVAAPARMPMTVNLPGTAGFVSVETRYEP